MQPRVVLIGGGVRSGKSAFALERAKALGARRAFVATAQALDDEMRERVGNHQRERDASFVTVEAPRALCEALAALRDVDVVVVDCLTLWLSNLLMDELSNEQIEAHVHELGRTLSSQRYASVIVTNEVGLGIVPDNALARRFRDLTGRAHQYLGHDADELYFAVMGQMLRLRPDPVTVLPRSPS